MLKSNNYQQVGTAQRQGKDKPDDLIVVPPARMPTTKDKSILSKRSKTDGPADLQISKTKKQKGLQRRVVN
ncbi:hypothetical protein GN958_ATG09523 [Phytophthora infestans]|uniref:Uncharacterized protein n=1 Tax=Phytophthora infestans TaxID=4787 RepID=A0A8S9USU0_PHYIN|nr:hypothetical protein GN958_ATG09523 [Phytophthora infestans]